MQLLSVILSGGSGSRLWPLSRQGFPKPFIRLGGKTLLEHAFERTQACGISDVIVMTNEDHHFLTREVLEGMDDPLHTTLMLEPKGRDTAPAIAVAALEAAQRFGGDAVMLVLSADHLVTDLESFVANARQAFRLASQGQLVVFGIRPTMPEVGFGYIEVAHTASQPQQVLRFVEKPDLTAAEEFVADGRHYWNGGMFCFTADAVLSALERHAPEVLHAARGAFAAAVCSGDMVRLEAHSFGLLPSISIDYAVMELADNVHVVPAKFGWSDIGSWPAVAKSQTADPSGNTMPLDTVAIDTSGTHVHVESHRPKIVATLGIHDTVIVDTPDALLVASKSNAQNVRKVVQLLQERHHEAATLAAVVHRPWGTYTTLAEEDGYKVKRITVRPGQSLSLQYHHQRAEHWVLVRGAATVQAGESVQPTAAGEYRYIPPKEKHRLTNIGEDELVLIEVQFGNYLGEDDIVRLLDNYGRA